MRDIVYGSIQELDMGRELFRTHQKYVSSLVVGAMVEALKLGQELPPLMLHKCTGGFDNFEDCFYGVFDGNHRLVAYRELDVNPKWGIPPCWAEVPYYEFLHKDIIQISGIPNEDIGGRLKDSLFYLPKRTVETFCEDNNLDPRVYLSQ